MSDSASISKREGHSLQKDEAELARMGYKQELK